MSMNIALSGLAAAQKDLNTTSNNIANASTVGFKGSRAEFADVYSRSVFSNAETHTGGGVQTSTVAQQFHEGSSQYTNNPLDMRLSGSGFFAVSPNAQNNQTSYLTRNGAFHLNENNQVVNGDGQYLLGYPVDNETQQVIAYQPQSLKIHEEFGDPSPSQNIDMALNLPKEANVLDAGTFNFRDPNTYNHSTSLALFDSLGSPIQLNSYYVKGADNWSVFYTAQSVTGEERPINATDSDTLMPPVQGENGLPMVDQNNAPILHKGRILTFDTSGRLNDNLDIRLESFNEANIDLGGADTDQTISLSFLRESTATQQATTQYASAFEIRQLNDKNGAGTGYLTQVDIDDMGNILASYSNGKDKIVGRVAVGNVANEQGLDPLGGSLWRVTQDSGLIDWGSATEGGLGAIKSGTLEQSNIDMTEELVDLISAQRNFQASSRALDVDNQLQQNILQIR